jgi:hypothetical protein
MMVYFYVIRIYREKWKSKCQNVFNTLSDNKLVDSVELKDDLATIKKIYKN